MDDDAVEQLDGTVTLEEMAVAIAEQRAEVEAAVARHRALYPAYHEAVEAASMAEARLKAMEQAMGGVKMAHAIRAAVVDAGVAFDGPPVVMVGTYRERRRLFALVAVGRAGTGLYRFKPERSHRYEGVEHAVGLASAEAHGFDREAPIPHHRDRSSSYVLAAGLATWQERGKGDYGRNGAYRPLAPPEGGNWRWIKVSEQGALPTGVAEAAPGGAQS